jgi:hypothetical protein
MRTEYMIHYSHPRGDGRCFVQTNRIGRPRRTDIEAWEKLISAKFEHGDVIVLNITKMSLPFSQRWPWFSKKGGPNAR